MIEDKKKENELNESKLNDLTDEQLDQVSGGTFTLEDLENNIKELIKNP